MTKFWVGCLMGVSVLLGAAGCAAGKQADSDQRPTLSVFGFSCELGGKKCRDRRIGRDMRAQVLLGVKATGRFRPMREDNKTKKHLLDVSDMLWTSGESEVLPDLADHVTSDYLLYGRVFAYDSESRVLKIELSLVKRENGNSIKVEGEGENGDMNAAVDNALERLAEQLKSKQL